VRFLSTFKDAVGYDFTLDELEQTIQQRGSDPRLHKLHSRLHLLIGKRWHPNLTVDRAMFKLVDERQQDMPHLFKDGNPFGKGTYDTLPVQQRLRGLRLLVVAALSQSKKIQDVVSGLGGCALRGEDHLGRDREGNQYWFLRDTRSLSGFRLVKESRSSGEFELITGDPEVLQALAITMQTDGGSEELGRILAECYQQSIRNQQAEKRRQRQLAKIRQHHDITEGWVSSRTRRRPQSYNYRRYDDMVRRGDESGSQESEEEAPNTVESRQQQTREERAAAREKRKAEMLLRVKSAPPESHKRPSLSQEQPSAVVKHEQDEEEEEEEGEDRTRGFGRKATRSPQPPSLRAAPAGRPRKVLYSDYRADSPVLYERQPSSNPYVSRSGRQVKKRPFGDENWEEDQQGSRQRRAAERQRHDAFPRMMSTPTPPPSARMTLRRTPAERPPAGVAQGHHSLMLDAMKMKERRNEGRRRRGRDGNHDGDDEDDDDDYYYDVDEGEDEADEEEEDDRQPSKRHRQAPRGGGQRDRPGLMHPMMVLHQHARQAARSPSNVAYQSAQAMHMMPLQVQAMMRAAPFLSPRRPGYYLTPWGPISADRPNVPPSAPKHPAFGARPSMMMPVQGSQSPRNPATVPSSSSAGASGGQAPRERTVGPLPPPFPSLASAPPVTPWMAAMLMHQAATRTPTHNNRVSMSGASRSPMAVAHPPRPADGPPPAAPLPSQETMDQAESSGAAAASGGGANGDGGDGVADMARKMMEDM